MGRHSFAFNKRTIKTTCWIFSVSLTILNYQFTANNNLSTKCRCHNIVSLRIYQTNGFEHSDLLIKLDIVILEKKVNFIYGWSRWVSAVEYFFQIHHCLLIDDNIYQRLS